MENNYKFNIMKLNLEKDIVNASNKHDVKNIAIPHLVDKISSFAKLEDNKLVFKNEDNTTLRINGKDADINDIIEDMKEKEIASGENFYFKVNEKNTGPSEVGYEFVEKSAIVW